MAAGDIAEIPVQWAPLYAVRTDGAVISRVSGTPRPLRPRLVNKYHHVTLCVDGRKHQRSVHRLVLETFVGERPDLVANHLNGVRTDNRLENLEWTTPSGNAQHAYATGLHTISEKHRQSAREIGRQRGKLCEADIRNIRAMYHSGNTNKAALARKFKINRKSVHMILNGTLYGHVQ